MNWKKMWKEMALACFKILFQCLPVGIEINLEDYIGNFCAVFLYARYFFHDYHQIGFHIYV
jgi:hypothetical protein